MISGNNMFNKLTMKSLLSLLIATLVIISSFAAIPQNECDVKFKQDVFTHSKQTHRPLRIKMTQNQVYLPCTITIQLPTNDRATFRIAGDEIDAITVPPIFQDKIHIKRISTDKLWLEVSSLEQESRSGVYVVSGHTVFGIQTPSNKDKFLSTVENITCTQTHQQHRRQLSGSVALTQQFSLCQLYNMFLGDDSYLRYDIQNVTLNNNFLDFVATDNERGYQVVEIFCDLKGGDGVKQYKIMFNLDEEQCPSISARIDTYTFVYSIWPLLVGQSQLYR